MMSPRMSPRTGLRITAIRLLCPDPAATAAFYAAAFGAVIAPGGARLALGAQTIELAPSSDRRDAPAPSNGTGFQHCALIVPDMDAAYAHLCGVPGWTPISRAGPERLPAASGGVRAFKFRDPDGHPLEFLAFPPDAVPPVWRGRSGRAHRPERWVPAVGEDPMRQTNLEKRPGSEILDAPLVLGIDHTAITVTDTERAVAFYARLGFRVTQRGVNRGPEQARMDAVDDPVVEVTGLAPPGEAPPHLELLCYRAPGSIPSACADDAPLATRIVLAGDGDAPGLLSDPDGHRLVLAADRL
jgi:catechol 2,3-dioxygenase-like lactoylglutathione lyase family enzyme